MVTFQISSVKLNAISFKSICPKVSKNSMLGSLLAPLTLLGVWLYNHSQRAVKNGKSAIKVHVGV